MIDWNPLIQKCHAAAVANGWWEQPRAIEETLMLVVTEVAEAVEWYRDYRDDTEVFKPHWEVPSSGVAVTKEDVGTDKDAPPDWKPVGIPSELADVAIRVCDLMGHMKFEATCVHNQTHTFDDISFVSQCFWLSQKITNVAPYDEDAAWAEDECESRIRVRLCGILAFVRDIAAANGIDLAAAIETKLAYNATRGHRHGGKRA